MRLALIIGLLSSASLAYADDAPVLGISLDAGAPDGVQGALLFRPWYWIRAHAGGGYNLVAPGIRGGLTLTPFDTTVRPIFEFELGRYFAGELPQIGELKGMRVNYDWASARAGLEVDWGGGAFFLEGGVTKVFANVKKDEVAANVALLGPAAKLGFIIWWE